MNAPARAALLQGAFAFIAILCLGIAALVLLPWHVEKEPPKPPPAKSAPGIVKIEEGGIRVEKAQSAQWHERLTYFGRVLANPAATVEVRAVFAGTVQALSTAAWPSLGTKLTEGKPLGWLEVRIGPQEKLDLMAKLAESTAKLKGAKEVLKIQNDRVKRLEAVPGTVPRGELDAALVHQAEAGTSNAVAQATVDMWQAALDSIKDKGSFLWKHPLYCPLEGEITELCCRPGMALEAGALIARVVDFRRPLVRLDLPHGHLPPTEIELQAIADPGPLPDNQALGKGRLTGPAGQVDFASQMQGFLFEFAANSAAATWRPGRLVKADVADPRAKPRPAIAFRASALLYHQGHSLVYVHKGEEKQGKVNIYERREIQILGRDGDLLFVSDGVKAGEQVAVERAQVLLSQEFRGEAEED
jgi:pyruvate/2-oxoglutarate dehydrogenase complex dihydrolipoamide acyltransferase (E2) component